MTLSHENPHSVISFYFMTAYNCFPFISDVLRVGKGKGKGKGVPITAHEGPEGE